MPRYSLNLNNLMNFVEKLSIIDPKLILPTGIYDYIIKRRLHGGLKIWILSSRGEYCFHQSKIKFISSHRCVISSIYRVSLVILGYFFNNFFSAWFRNNFSPFFGILSIRYQEIKRNIEFLNFLKTCWENFLRIEKNYHYTYDILCHKS